MKSFEEKHMHRNGTYDTVTRHRSIVTHGHECMGEGNGPENDNVSKLKRINFRHSTMHGSVCTIVSVRDDDGDDRFWAINDNRK